MSDPASSEPWIAPRYTPHPDETPLSPYTPRQLQSELEDDAPQRRELIAVAGNIRSTEAQLTSSLKQLGKPTPADLRDVALNPRRQMLPHKSGQFPQAKRARSQQQNLETHYRRWAQLCEDYSEWLHNSG